MTPAEMVREFHETYGCPVRDTPNAEVPEKALRVELINEEFDELIDALGVWDTGIITRQRFRDEGPSNIVEVADALGDLLYVIYGAAYTFGIDLDSVLAEIHRSNMSKLGEDGKPIYREDGKVLKGPNFFKPDLKKVLGL